jgi:hypothetical protein
MHKHKLHYDVQTCQVKIASIKIDQIVAIKEQTLLALASTLITAKYKGKVDKDRMYIAAIFATKIPNILGKPAVVSIDKKTTAKSLSTTVPRSTSSSTEMMFLASWTLKPTI